MKRLGVGSGKLFDLSVPGGGGSTPPPIPSGTHIVLETLTDNLVTEGGDQLVTE